MSDSISLKRRCFLKKTTLVAASSLILPSLGVAALPEVAQKRRLCLVNIHTQEQCDSHYFRYGHYLEDGLQRICSVLKDHRQNQVTEMDKSLIELLHRIQQHPLIAGQEIQVISGYRSEQTNRMLAKNSSGVARNSFHTKGQAADIRVQGLACEQLAQLAKSFAAGGVGAYPKSNFVHVDTGPVRSWRG